MNFTIIFNKLKNQSGYTLIEMTIVLMIITVATSLSFANMKKTFDAAERNEFILQFQQDILLAQQKAISENTLTTVFILNNNKEYVIRQGSNVLLRRKFPDNVSFVPVSLSLNDISFLGDGNARRSGTMLIRTETSSYRLVMLLGRGRFYIEKL